MSNNFKIVSEPSKFTNEKNSPCRIDIPNIKCIVEGVLKSKKLPLIIILAFVGIPNIVKDFLRPKKLSSIIMTFVGIYILRNFIIGQDQKTDKNETCEQNPGE